MPYKILFIIASTLGCGSEISTYSILNYLNPILFKKIAVVINNVYFGNADQRIDKNIRVVNLIKKNRYSVFRLLYSISKIIKKEKPALIYTPGPYTNFIALLARKIAKVTVPVVVAQRSNLVELQHENFPLIKSILVRLLYPQANAIHCNSQGIKSDLVNNFNFNPDKVKVIYNPYDLKVIVSQAKEKVEHPWFNQDMPILLACGRLTVQKNYPLMLRAVRRVLEQRPVRLMILGEGEERRHLEAYTRHLGLSSSVALLGFRANPFAYMARATAFVMSSSWEGFPRVLVEAMACGLLRG